MKIYLVFLALVGAIPVFGEVVGSHGISVDLPASEGWVFAGRTEIVAERMEVWTARNVDRRESIQFSVVGRHDVNPTRQDQGVAAWERGLFADGRKESILAKDIELSGRKARYVLARWRERKEPFFHFIMIVAERGTSFFSIVSTSDSELGGDVSAKCVRSLRFAAP